MTDGSLIKRHSLLARVWHWLNAVTVIVLLMSGLMILNAHPRLYWGEFGANADHAWLELAKGEALAFPGWMTIPSHYSLAEARLWHLAFAWVLGIGLVVYLLRGLIGGELRTKLRLGLAELSPRHLWHEVRAHAALRLPTGEAARSYNSLQKLAYGGVLFILLPLVILTGLTMSPGMNAAWPWLTELLGGRQSARSIHFLCAVGLALFLAVHLIMVVLAGPLNELRSMITGWYRLPAERVP